MEQDGHDAPGAGVGRSQNVLYVMPHDWTSIAQFLDPIVQRIDPANHAVQLIVVASDAEAAGAVAAATVRLGEVAGRRIEVAAATGVRRTARLLRLQPPHVVTGTAENLVGLLRGAAIKLDTVQAVCIAWADEIATLSKDGMSSLEALMTEIPKEASRTIVASELTPPVEELVERYARRARRVISVVNETDLPVDVDYLTVSPQTRLTVLRRLLDEVDPASAVIITRDPSNAGQVARLLETLGYRGPDAPVRTGSAAAPGTDLVVLFDLPETRAGLRDATAGAERAIALVQPRQVNSLRGLAAGGRVGSHTLADAGASARDRDTRLRAELRGELQHGQFGRELLALEELLGEFDGIEIAAAAVRLLERERVERLAEETKRPAPAAAAQPQAGAMTRLFLTIGSRDNARPGDIVGAIANTAAISGGDVGKVDVRESHTLVEVSASVADKVIETVTGTSIKGRRVIVRRDEGRPKREFGGERREFGGARREGAGPRREGGGPRRESGVRRERPADRGERRVPRRPREGRE